MTAAQMRLDQAMQICQLQANELEAKNSQLHQIMAMFDEHEQRLEDTFNCTHDDGHKKAAFYRLKELRSLRKEIETIQGQEG